jgi:drug/metabolite transporter (DMT)-like permease
LLNLTKYPPSAAFLLLTLGLNLILLWLLARLGGDRRPRNPLAVLGRAALLFYTLHLYLYALLGLLIGRATPLLLIYPVWAASLLILYPACKWYGTFRRQRGARSVWRLL